MKIDGFIGGGQWGDNFQFANKWVGGFESDFQGIATGKSLVEADKVEEVTVMLAEAARRGVTRPVRLSACALPGRRGGPPPEANPRGARRAGNG